MTSPISGPLTALIAGLRRSMRSEISTYKACVSVDDKNKLSVSVVLLHSPLVSSLMIYL